MSQTTIKGVRIAGVATCLPSRVEGNFALQAAVGATGARTAVASNDTDVGNAHILALRRAP